MQREFVNINFPEPKGASQLVCHLFTGPESCTLELNRPLLDPPGQRDTTTTSDPHRPVLPKKKKGKKKTGHSVYSSGQSLFFFFFKQTHSFKSYHF